MPLRGHPFSFSFPFFYFLFNGEANVRVTAYPKEGIMIYINQFKTTTRKGLLVVFINSLIVKLALGQLKTQKLRSEIDGVYLVIY